MTTMVRVFLCLLCAIFSKTKQEVLFRVSLLLCGRQKMPLDQQDLSDLNLSESLINRLLAVYGPNAPEPPLVMKDYGYVGQYHAIDEFYAMKLLVVQGKRPTVRGVLGIIGGTTTTVSANIKTLKKELPAEEFAFEPVADGESDATNALKRELIKKERALMDIELSEQEEFYTDLITSLEKSQSKALSALQSQLDKAYGENAKIDQILKDKTRDHAELSQRLLKEAVNKVELRNAQLLVEDYKGEIHTLKHMVQATNSAYQSEREASAKTIQDLRDERDYADSRAQQEKAKLENASAAIIRYHAERDEHLNLIHELKHQISQTELVVKHEHSVSELIETIGDNLQPLAKLDALIKALAGANKKEAVDVKTIVTAITDLSTNVLNMTQKVSKSNDK
jgi:chromosome segregation ATPase